MGRDVVLTWAVMSLVVGCCGAAQSDGNTDPGADREEQPDGEASVPDSAIIDDSSILSGQSLLPTATVARDRVIGVPNNSDLHLAVDDGSSFNPDLSASYIRTEAGNPAGSVTLGFGAGSGSATQAQVN